MKCPMCGADKKEGYEITKFKEGMIFRLNKIDRPKEFFFYETDDYAVLVCGKIITFSPENLYGCKDGYEFEKYVAKEFGMKGTVPFMVRDTFFKFKRMNKQKYGKIEGRIAHKDED